MFIWEIKRDSNKNDEIIDVTELIMKYTKVHIKELEWKEC